MYSKSSILSVRYTTLPLNFAILFYLPPPLFLVTLATTQPQRPRAPKEKPHCSVCKQPMKGHKNVTNCPKNKP